MSVTFCIQDAPQRKVQPYPESDPDYWIDEPVAPFTEMNLSNINAGAVIRAVDLDNLSDYRDGYGQWQIHHLPVIIRRCMDILDTPAGEEGSWGEYLQNRAQRLIAICHVALKVQKPVIFC